MEQISIIIKLPGGNTAKIEVAYSVSNELAVHRTYSTGDEAKTWVVTDTITGLSVHSGFPTRRDALAFAEAPLVKVVIDLYRAGEHDIIKNYHKSWFDLCRKHNSQQR